jgi:gamma-glutamyltranspeptidase
VSIEAVPSSYTAALAAPHSLASEAGLGAYRDGGNAIDAAIAAAAVLTVVYPHNVTLGGDLVALVRTPDGKVSCVNASGWAAAATAADSLRTRHGSTMPTLGADAVTVPGGVRGWEVLRTFGARLTWGATLRPAQTAAETGAPVSPSLAAHIADADPDLGEDFERVFRPNGEPRRVGDLFVQPELADSIGELRENGPDDFYEGDLSLRMVDYLRGRGSLLAADDFAAFRPEIVPPLELTFRGINVMTSPPNTHGFLLLRALKAIDGLGIVDPLGEGLGTFMSVLRHGNETRSRLLADPRHQPWSMDSLVHDVNTVASKPDSEVDQARIAHGDTVGIAAADSDGYAISLIQSVYHSFGSGLIDPDTGILFQNRGSGFSLRDESPNVIAPRKRPAHTLMPVITTQTGRLKHVLATMGGQGQPQILAQVLLRAMDGASAEDAIAAPRAVVGRQIDGYSSDTVAFEEDLAATARSSLAASGLPGVEVARHTEGLGQTNAVFASQNGSMTAASDPRSDGAAFVANYQRRTSG